MERHSLKTGMLNWIALLGLAIGLEVVSKIADSATAELGAAFTLVGLQLRQRKQPPNDKRHLMRQRPKPSRTQQLRPLE